MVSKSKGAKTVSKTGGARTKTKAKRVVPTDSKPKVTRKLKEKTAAVPSTVPPAALVVGDASALFDENEKNSSGFAQLLASRSTTSPDVKEGEVVKGRVIGTAGQDVLVDVGFKSEGIIPLEEFGDASGVHPGEEIDVLIEILEDQNGQLILSKQKADFLRVWDRIKEAHDTNQAVTGKVMRRIKGGMVVDVFGVEAFLPGSQAGLRQVMDFDAMVGQNIELKVVRINKLRRNIVVSRRQLLEEERDKMRQHLLTEIAVGQVREGIVKNITDFGVFIDLGGVDGLLHITDMSWGRISHPSEVVAINQKINVKILDFDKNTGRISLGLKQLTPYPWEGVEERYPMGRRVKGRVVSLTDYGAFVELEKGVEGLIHISEMSWTQHVKHPSKILSVGDIVEAIVLSTDKQNEKISLGIKQLTPDPWQTLDLRYPVGTRLSGKVRNLTAFGAFVELEEGIDGLVHISDMSWTKRISHPSEVMKKGDKVDVVVLGVDKDNRRVSLGFKQMQNDPWPSLVDRFRSGTEMQGKISRFMDRGVVVELPGDVEGFVPLNHLGISGLPKPQLAFKEGESLPVVILEFDAGNHKIICSVENYFQRHDASEREKYVAAHPIRPEKQEKHPAKAPEPVAAEPPPAPEG
ncbi:MAG TPA: 30S ribosomal protein S1 [Verrucomicrobiae bacterium]|nr:30S ribosomal protein S1 [Verrucomicrobiae bacterium]